jgi:hypothetical protein
VRAEITETAAACNRFVSMVARRSAAALVFAFSTERAIR